MVESALKLVCLRVNEAGRNSEGLRLVLEIIVLQKLRRQLDEMFGVMEMESKKRRPYLYCHLDGLRKRVLPLRPT